LRVSPIVGSGLNTEVFASSESLPGSLDAFDTAPPLAAFGQDLTHFVESMMSAAVVAEGCLCFRRHRFKYPSSVIKMVFQGAPVNNALGA
jgi:hypothetical protein